MDKNAIEQLLRLQNSAYEVLIWLDKRARTELELLSDENLEKWGFAESCEAWVREVQGMFPQNFRPAPDEIPAFARLFSSFFQTSFRVVESAPVRAYDYFGHESGYVAGNQRKLMAGAPEPKKSSKGKARVNESARELRLIALEELALENEILLERADLQKLENDADLRAALTLWTYVHELNRRAHFASQGQPVRALWLAMDKKEREKITANKVLEARDLILAALLETNKAK